MDGGLSASEIHPSLSSFTQTTGVGALGSKHVFYIKAVNKAGESVMSEPLLVTVGTIPEQP
jgi:hypothetical protein